MVVPAQGVCEASRNGGSGALLPQADDDQLVSIRPTQEHEIPIVEIADQHGSALAGLDASGGVRPRHPVGDLGLLLEGPANTLPVALSGMLGDDDDHAPVPAFFGFSSGCARC